MLERLQLLLGDAPLLEQEFFHFRVQATLFQHGLHLRQGNAGAQVVGRELVRVPQIGVCLGDLGIAGLVPMDLRIGQLLSERSVLLFYLLRQTLDHAAANASF